MILSLNITCPRTVTVLVGTITLPLPGRVMIGPVVKEIVAMRCSLCTLLYWAGVAGRFGADDEHGVSLLHDAKRRTKTDSTSDGIVNLLMTFSLWFLISSTGYLLYQQINFN
jgi:hypothetical protein